jgi:hypothetical protein
MATVINRQAQNGEPMTTDEAIRMGAEHVEAVASILERCPPDSVLLVRHEELVAAPQQTLARICAFVGVETNDPYLNDCASIVFDAPRKTRESVPWSGAQVDWVSRNVIARFEFLAGYTYAS